MFSLFLSVLVSTTLWLPWALYFLPLLLAIYLVWRKWPSISGLIARRRGEIDGNREPISERRLSGRSESAGSPRTAPRIGSLSGLVAGAFLAGFFYGWLLRDHQLVSNSHTYQGVSVIGVLSDRSILVSIPGFDRSYQWDFCQPRKFNVGQLFDITYEKDFLRDCKQLAGPNSVWFHKEDVNAAISTR
jgi:hypothetical protein